MTALNSPIPMSGPVPQPGSSNDCLDRLSQPARTEATGPFAALFLSLISLGMLPLLIWPTRWSEYLDRERHDLLDLIQWWRERVTPANAKSLDNIARRFRPRPILTVLPWLAVGFSAVMMISLLTQGVGLDRMWDLTYNHRGDLWAPLWGMHPQSVQEDGWPNNQPPNYQPRWVVYSPPLAEQLYPAWIFSLSFGYFCHFYGVRSHAKNVYSLVEWTNGVGRQQGLARVNSHTSMSGMHVLWTLLFVGFCVNHVWWAIPMVFAGAMQRRYMTQASPAIRMALAKQAREMIASVPRSSDRLCGAWQCGARMPVVARFCPRCGAAV